MILVTRAINPGLERYSERLKSVFESSHFTNAGPLHIELKNKLESYLGVENLLLVSNGTLAIQVALKVLGVKGKAITTPFSFAATATSLVWENITPVFSDIDEKTFNLDPRKLPNKPDPMVSALLPVHVYGNPCDHANLQNYADNHRLRIIYDAAHAFNVKQKGESILRWGDATTLSFHATKIFHTIEGGAIIFKEKEAYERASKLINFGFEIGARDVFEAGTNAKMSEFHAAMGLLVLEDFEKVQSIRKGIFSRYLEAFTGKLIPQLIPDSVDWNYSYCPFLFPDTESLLKAEAQLNAENIFPRRYFYPSIDQFSAFRKYSSDQTCLTAHEVSARVLCLPSFDDLDIPTQEKICRIVLNAIEAVKTLW